ncbi:MAG: hypothetical protein WBG57_10830 [Ornithinimicrobium sp.]
MGLKVVHESSGIECAVPLDWQVDASHPDMVMAIEAERAAYPRGLNAWSGALEAPVAVFRANLVLTVVNNAELTFGQWQRASDHLLPIALKDYELLDVQKVRLAGRPGGRRLARHLSTSGEVLVMQQWFTVCGHLGVTLTATCDVGSYLLLLPQMQTAAVSLTLPRDAGPN